MKKIITVAAITAAVALALLRVSTAGATVAEPTFQTCANLAAWYANSDELDRMPTATVGGLRFEGNDLIHHATTGTVETLTHGAFTASPAPDQPSFFSVEVWEDASPSGYATLRWNSTTSKWDMVTGGEIYSATTPAALVDMPAVHKSHTVRSFGVGYTNSPPGTVAAVVSSVTFGGTAYNLTCAPAASPSSSSPSPSHSSASPTASASHTASASPSASASRSASVSASPSRSAVVIGSPIRTEPPALALTGSNSAAAFTIGGALILLGVVGIALSRYRRRRFEA